MARPKQPIKGGPRREHSQQKPPNYLDDMWVHCTNTEQNLQGEGGPMSPKGEEATEFCVQIPVKLKLTLMGQDWVCGQGAAPGPINLER